MPEHHEVPIFINRHKYETTPGPHTGRQILAIAGLSEGYDLLLLAGEGDHTGGEVILADQVVEIHAGMHFRAIPGNRTFGGDDPPEIWARHAADLGRQLGRTVDIAREGNQLFAIVRSAALPPAVYSVSASDVLLLGDTQYPASAMDMFWMEEAVTLSGGAVPDHMSHIEAYVGRPWRRWSWHRNGIWTPGVDDLLSHWAFVESCWGKESGREPVGV
jgi:hypothetical protein